MVSRFPEDFSLPSDRYASNPARVEELLSEIRSRVSPQESRAWLSSLECQFLPPNRLVFSLLNAFHRDWVEKHFLELFHRCARELFEFEVRIEFALNASSGIEISPRFTDSIRDPLPLRRSLPAGKPETLRDDFRFENFVVGSTNGVAQAAATAVCKAPGTTYNPLFLVGDPGVGKSHLLQATCHRLQSSSNLRIKFLPTEQHLVHFLHTSAATAATASHAPGDSLDVLLLDNVDLIQGQERHQNALLRLCKELVDAGKQILLAGRNFPRASSGLLTQLASHFRSGLVARLDPPCFELRVSILLRKAQQRNVDLPLEVAESLARSVPGGVRELEGALSRLVHFSTQQQSSLTVDFLRSTPGELSLAPGESDVPRVCSLNVTQIIKTVQEYYQLSSRDMISRTKTRSIVLPRQVGMFLARKLTALSLAEIGLHFGGRDHTTVLYAQDRIASLESNNPQVRNDLRILRDRLTATWNSQL